MKPEDLVYVKHCMKAPWEPIKVMTCNPFCVILEITVILACTAFADAKNSRGICPKLAWIVLFHDLGKRKKYRLLVNWDGNNKTIESF